MSWKLVLIGNHSENQNFTIPTDRPILIGRGTGSDTKIADPKLSRVHCRIFVEQGRVIVEDAGSTGGTYLHGKRIERSVLDVNEEIQIGDSRLRLETDNPLDFKTTASSSPMSSASGLTSPSMLQELIGTSINRFKISGLVAHGKTGGVFQAIDSADGKTVAIKVLHPQLTMDERQRERFIRAMRTMLPIRHPHIVRLLRAGKQSGLCWLAMEWVPGSSLRSIIDQIGIRGALDWKELWRIAVHVGRALAEGERRSIVHRNVTPTNIIRRDQDRHYLLTDFVFAKALEETSSAELTRPGDIVGELPYLAPERFQNAQEIGHRSDQYGLGVTLYVLATGELPFRGGSIAALWNSIENGAPTPPVTTALGFNPRLSDLILKLIEKEPSRRFGSAAAMLDELDSIGRYTGLSA